MRRSFGAEYSIPRFPTLGKVVVGGSHTSPANDGSKFEGRDRRGSYKV